MRLLLFVGLGLSASFLGALSAAPIPQSRKTPRLYFPTQVGAKWVYRDGSVEWTHVVSAVEEQEGAKVVTVSEVSRANGAEEVRTVRVSPQSLWWLRKEGAEYRKWHCLLLLPQKARELEPLRLGGSIVVKSEGHAIKLSGPEQVTVPAGTFWCVRVEGSAGPIEPVEVPANPLVPVPDATNIYDSLRWYAPEVGLVKEKVWRGDIISRLVELKSFTRGRD